MPSFQGKKFIQLQPFDNSINYEFQVTVCSSSIANNGFLAFGRSVTSISVSGYAEDKVTPANDLIASTPVVHNNVITVPLSFPSINGPGRYNLRFILTLDNGEIVEADFNRVEAGNL